MNASRSRGLLRGSPPPAAAGAALLLALAGTAGARPAAVPREGPVDAHIHLFSEACVALLARHAPEAASPGVHDASAALAMLDRAGAARAAAISGAYLLDLPTMSPVERAAAVRRENEWLAAQVGAAGGRLRGFCSVPPLAPYAEAEVRSCAGRPHVHGLKLYLTNSGVDLRDPAHLGRLGDLFALAGSLGLDLLVHLRTEREDYGAEDARAFVEHVLPRAGTATVQVAHVGGWGGYDAATDAVLGEFAAALEEGRAQRDGLVFDLAMVVLPGTPDVHPRGDLARLEERMRRIGAEHFLFGSDWPLYETGEYAREMARVMPGVLALARGRPAWSLARLPDPRVAVH